MHKLAKLTNDKVRWIREQAASGQKTSTIAAAVHVSDSVCRRIIRGAAWKHVA